MRHQYFLHRTNGFSLIQISVLLVAGAIILASLLPGNNAGDYNKKTAANIAKLDAVEGAMMTFMTKNGRRPCPADGQYDINSQYFGIEAANPGTCTGGTPAAPMGPDVGTGFVVAGVIPTKTLSLPDDDAFDAWGRRFTYTVDKRATSTSTCYAQENAGNVGDIVVETTSVSGTVINNVMSLYISHGPDGHGAFPEEGSTVANRINRGITDADSLVNAGVNSSFTYNTTNFTNARVKKDHTTGFDDLVYYHPDTMNTCCIGSGCNTYDATSNPSAYGFVAHGEASTAAGTSLAIGDINGDGIDDLIIGAPGTGAGKVYVVFGSRMVFGSPITLSASLASSTPPAGFVISGASSGDKFGTSVAVGDINGDGIKDIIIGAPGYNTGSNVGAVYVVFGKTTAFSNFTASAPDGTTYFRIDANTGDTGTGTSVASGDINGDGINDVIIGAPTSSSNAGAAYVVFGKATAWASTFALSTLTGANGIELDGSSTEKAGTSVASGDINGDGVDDVIIGAPGATSNGYSANGNTYVLFGNSTSWASSNPVTLSALAGSAGITNGTKGFVAHGIYTNDASGTSVAAGDINADGIADLIIGAPNTTVQGRANAGSTYVVYGQNASMYSWPAAINLSAIAVGAQPLGFRLDGAASDNSGTAVASGCAVNNRGAADLLIGAPGTSLGGGYVAFGTSVGWTSTKNLSTLFGTFGFNAPGIASGGKTGTAVAALNINSTNQCALVIGAPVANGGAGYVYVVLGQPTWSPTFDLTTLR